MKQFFTLLSLLLVMGMSANVMAQTQTANHYPGEVHTFQVADNSSGGFSYAWEVYTASDLKTTVDGGYTLSGENSAVLTIEWTTIATGTYYVGVTETNGENGCFTSRYVPITIEAATYDLIVSAVDENGDAVSDLDDCMTGSGQILSNAETLDISGTNDRYFKVMLTNDGATAWSQGSWTFDYTLTGLDENSTETITNVEIVGAQDDVSGITGVAAGSATPVSVSNLGEFIVKVTTSDNPGNSTAFDVTLPFSASNLKVGAGLVSETDVEANSATYTLRTYPTTSVITID